MKHLKVLVQFHLKTIEIHKFKRRFMDDCTCNEFKKLYTHSLVLVGYRDGLEPDFTIQRTEDCMENWLWPSLNIIKTKTKTLRPMFPCGIQCTCYLVNFNTEAPTMNYVHTWYLKHCKSASERYKYC